MSITSTILLMELQLGLVTAEAEDKQLVESLLHVMEVTGADFTKTFRSLSRIVVPGTQQLTPLVRIVKIIALSNILQLR